MWFTPFLSKLSGPVSWVTGDGVDTAYFEDLPTSCSAGLGAGTLNEVETVVGDVGEHFWLNDCPF